MQCLCDEAEETTATNPRMAPAKWPVIRVSVRGHHIHKDSGIHTCHSTTSAARCKQWTDTMQTQVLAHEELQFEGQSVMGNLIHVPLRWILHDCAVIPDVQKQSSWHVTFILMITGLNSNKRTATPCEHLYTLTISWSDDLLLFLQFSSCFPKPRNLKLSSNHSRSVVIACHKEASRVKAQDLSITTPLGMLASQDARFALQEAFRLFIYKEGGARQRASCINQLYSAYYSRRTCVFRGKHLQQASVLEQKLMDSWTW